MAPGWPLTAGKSDGITKVLGQLGTPRPGYEDRSVENTSKHIPSN